MAAAACTPLCGRAAPRMLDARRTPRTRPSRAVAALALGAGGAEQRPQMPRSSIPAPVPVGQLKMRLRMHRQRLEHLLKTGAASAAELQPLVSDLRQITNMVAAAGAWERLRDQVQALERALAAASASSSTSSTSSSSSTSSMEAPLTFFAPDGRALEAAAPPAFALPGSIAASPPAPPAQLTRAGQFAVCTGKKCAAQGALCTLAAAQAAAAGSPVEVVASKCMGKCGKGPCVRARAAGRDGSALSRNVDAAAAAALLRQHFGEPSAAPSRAPSPLPPPAV